MAETSCLVTPETCVADCPETTLRFTVDPNQFVAPQNAGEPPRRQITRVTMNEATFVAEAILMSSGAKGFYEDAGALGSRLMIVRPDGSARLVLQPSNEVWTGTCVDAP